MADLVLGTYEHDLFKPFWLGNDKHSRLGYAFLNGKVPEHPLRRVAVLLHTDFQANLAQLQAQESGSWPKVLMAAPLIDRIASASYSLLGEEKGEEAIEAAGIEPVVANGNKHRSGPKPVYQQIQETWPPSVQNPFTRLPVWSGPLHVDRLQGGKTPKGDGYQKGGDYTASRLRPRFLSLGDGNVGAPHTGQKFEAVVVNIVNTTNQQQELLTQSYPIFAERTYPHANDTGLAAHTKLAANLYHLLLQNLDMQAELANGTVDRVEAGRLAEWLNPKVIPMEVPSLLACSTVTIRLAGLEDRFLNAVRLDDLQGAKLLADRVRAALKQRICQDLFGFGELSGLQSVDGHTLADLLCLSEDRFGLTYLAPAICGDEQKLLAALFELYAHALEDVVDLPATSGASTKGEGLATTAPLLGYLIADIRRTLEDANIADPAIRQALTPSREELLTGLRVLLPAVAIAPVVIPSANSALKPEDIGVALVTAYQMARKVAQQGQAPPAAALALLEANGAAETEGVVICSASNASPAWTILADYAYGRNGKQLIEALQQYFHDFRAEQEELSQASVALRALAHGVAEAPLLRQFVHAKAPTPDAKGNYPLVYQAAQVGQQALALPPFLERRGEISRHSGLVDLNGAYVRVRREGAVNGDPLIRFPSVSYAADRMGNVAMITLRPTAALYAPQCIDPAFMERVLQGEATWAELQAYGDLRTYYFHADGQVDAALRQELLTIPAHLARVLQRQQTITTFFERLPLRLEAAGVRVLTLEERFPVGRYLLPADQLTTALDVLDLALCLDLLAVHAKDVGLNDTQAMTAIGAYNVLAAPMTAETAALRQQLHTFLAAYVPEVLVGTTMIFKHKQALYLMLRAEERLHHAVKPKPVFAMGVTDLRGTLIDRGELQGEFAFAEWAEILTAAQQLDRRSLDGLAHDRLTVERLAKLNAPATPILQEALDAWVEARWINRVSGADVKKRVKRALWPLGEAEKPAEERTKVIHFLKRATRG